MRKQTQITEIRHEPSYKQLEEKMNRMLFLCGNRTGYLNSESVLYIKLKLNFLLS
jgi:hypothetical protein